ncbi:MAG: hypothetical protein II855_02350, partial [Candidatus Methanomethylophilaceae archaeon]|nr:hypothetical protein [Candidatus Methanomethylophilaceae archaeon]
MNSSILETSQILKRIVRETLLSNYSISEVNYLPGIVMTQERRLNYRIVIDMRRWKAAGQTVLEASMSDERLTSSSSAREEVQQDEQVYPGL